MNFSQSSTDNVTPDSCISAPNDRNRYRTRILLDHLRIIASKDPDLDDLLVFESTVSLLESLERDESSTATESQNPPHGPYLPAALSVLDIQGFNALRRPDSATQARLLQELNVTLVSILDFWSAKEGLDDVSQEEIYELARQLPDGIRIRQEGTITCKEDIRALRQRIARLAQEINEMGPGLEEQLCHALSTYPPILRSTRAAEADLIATSIETLLLRLAVLRARAHRSLYGYSTTTDPPRTTSHALEAVHSKLSIDEQGLDAELEEAEKQLESYEELMGIVDGSGGFRQIVEDWTGLRGESEECKRDLRRLGWTGD